MGAFVFIGDSGNQGDNGQGNGQDKKGLLAMLANAAKSIASHGQDNGQGSQDAGQGQGQGNDQGQGNGQGGFVVLGTPANTGRVLSEADISKMSVDEINANWENIAKMIDA